MFVNYDGFVKIRIEALRHKQRGMRSLFRFKGSRVQGFRGSSERKACQNFARDIGAVERMLKSLIKSNKTNT